MFYHITVTKLNQVDTISPDFNIEAIQYLGYNSN